jgi:uncharacterized membrane protein
MTIAHTLATPAPTSRWLLLGSLALNLFLIGLMVALITRDPPATDRSPAGRIDGLASALPAADGAKLRANFATNRANVEGARKRYEDSREAIRAVLRREPFDNAALRAAMAESRAARQEFDTALQAVMAQAAGEMSPAGRTALADWRSPPQTANR